MDARDSFQRYLDVGIAFTNLTRAKAEELVAELVKNGEFQSHDARARVDELLERSRAGREVVTAVVRSEVTRQLESVGITSLEDVAQQVASLIGRAAEAGKAASGTTAAKQAAPKQAAPKKAAKKSAAKKAAAKKSPAKKAAAKKAAPAKAAAPKKAAKKSAAKKAAPKKAAAKKAAAKSTATEGPGTSTPPPAPFGDVPATGSPD
jgi:polyhydroxyalkanoate synthesis regulator phasin